VEATANATASTITRHEYRAQKSTTRKMDDLSM
jgi:hypothetical protein